MAYVVGDLIRVYCMFVVANAPTDPTTVTFRYKTPGGVVTSYVYLTDAAVVKDSVGRYYVDVSVTSGGTWTVRWESTGTAQGANQTTFTVDAATVP